MAPFIQQSTDDSPDVPTDSWHALGLLAVDESLRFARAHRRLTTAAVAVLVANSVPLLVAAIALSIVGACVFGAAVFVFGAD